MNAPMLPEDLELLREAARRLENPGIAVRISSLLGTPIEAGAKLLPAGWQKTVYNATRNALEKCLGLALCTLNNKPCAESWDWSHKVAVAATGSSGVFGLAALPFELPVTTAIIFRSVADIARSRGENLADPRVQTECLLVFALGGASESDDAAQSSYYATRLALAKLIAEAGEHLATRSTGKEAGPVLVKLIQKIAERFGIAVSSKAMATAIPAIGAATGAAVNTLFMDHYQGMAHGHFTVRQLIRKYDEETIRKAYGEIRGS